MFRSSMQGKKVSGAFPGRSSGDTFTGISYGDDRQCQKCGQHHTINETQQVYEVARTIVDCLPPTGNAMMIGVLRSSDDLWFAACSPHDGTAGYNAFVASIRTKKHFLPRLTVVGSLPQNQSDTRSGQTLSARDIRSCTVNGHPIAGRCAAPKLLHFAVSNNLRRPWTMSEVFYDPANLNQIYKDYITAPSCQSCQNLLPLILCKHSAGDINMNQFIGMMRTVGWM